MTGLRQLLRALQQRAAEASLRGGGLLKDLAVLRGFYAALARVDHQFALPWEPSHHEVLLAAIADPDNADVVIDRAYPRAA